MGLEYLQIFEVFGNLCILNFDHDDPSETLRSQKNYSLDKKIIMNYDNCTANRQFDRTNMDVVLGIQQRNWKYKLKRCFTTTSNDEKMQTPSSAKQTALTLKHQKWFSRRFPLTARDLRKTAKNNKLWLRSKPNRRDECWVYFSLAERQGENRQSLICKLVSLAVNINFRIKFFGERKNSLISADVAWRKG